MKINILINDGLSNAGKQKLLDYNFHIIDQNVKQNELIDFINKNNRILLNDHIKKTYE